MPTESLLQTARNSSAGYVLCTHGPPALRMFVSAVCLFLVLVDVIVNNWEFNDLVGNARTLLTPVLNVASQQDLTNAFTFADGSSLDSVSSVGLYMINYTLQTIHAHDSNMYVLSADSYTVDSPVNDICGMLVQSYRLANTSSSLVSLGVVQDGIEYVRGTAMTNLLQGTRPIPPPGSNHDALVSFGYLPSRIDADMRLTTPVKVPPPESVAFANVSMYRFCARAYCTGCDPTIELGQDLCTVQTSFSPTTRTLVVHSSVAIAGHSRVLGMMMTRSAVSVGSLYVRALCVLFGLAAFATSHKTVRWTDSVSLSSWYKKLVYIAAPAQYRYQCRSVDFSYFCFNSDVFVVGYVVAVLLDEKACNLYSRTLHKWNDETIDSWTSRWVFVRIAAMNFRWVWLNCFLVKVIKVLANVLSTARYTGRNFVVGYFNFSTIAYVYLAGIPLMYRNNFMDYGNSDVATLTTATQLLDGITVDFFNSVLMRGYPGLIFLMFVSLMAVLTLDVAINRKWRHQVANNSLGRQHLYNSTSIIADVGYSFLTWPDFKGQAISMSVRSLCMMQWFLTCHTLRFGLPEDPSNVRGMTSKAGSALSQVVTTTQRRSVGTWREGRQQSSASVANEFFMVTQDSDGYIHLFNARKTEIQALSMEVNVQADAKYVLT